MIYIKAYILNKSLSYIKKHNPEINGNELDKIKYGLEGIYLLITKLLFISVVAIYFNIFFEFLIFTFFFNFIRMFAFGVHAPKSFICLIISSLIFITLPGIAPILEIHIVIKFFICLICLYCIILYAPADTKKRPLINLKKRRRFKFMSILVSIIYIFIILISKNIFLSNVILFALVTEVVLILPITYKLFRTSYNNYKDYCSIINNSV